MSAAQTNTPTFTTPNTPAATVDVDLYGTYVFRWTIVNGSCNTQDDVEVRFAEAATAGSDQQICGATTTTLAGNTPSVGTGTWTYVSGPDNTPTFTTPNTPGATVDVDLYGTYVFRWTIVNGSCNTFDEVEVRFAEAATAGSDQQICGATTTTLAGNTPSVGTGTWTYVSGPDNTPTFTTPNTPAATVDVDLYGTYVFR